MTHPAQFKHRVPFRLERVFLCFANPNNLPRLMPPETDMRIEKLQGGLATIPTQSRATRLARRRRLVNLHLISHHPQPTVPRQLDRPHRFRSPIPSE